MLIGVLALQGAFREHQEMLASLGVESRQVRKPEQLEGIDGLIIPGGESTTMGKLLQDYHLFEPIRQMALQGMPVFGTCAGLILLAREITGSSQPRLGLMDITVARNAFGRQVESFEVDLSVPVLGEEPLRAVFIRAPYIVSTGPEVEVLARYGDKIVLARQGRFIGCAFHPELTDDTRLHRLFLEQCGLKKAD
ncbi:pyridoxal phosphate synthase yaaE subunit [Desulfofundulus australicus DSM 11792]|uniref:Pyridoxal 5'-phosphate synthase subunit PdxT n=1 Tax=Desulfofundulus australicus DSM 11792 TaxID=1121425 RepID=A0A1M5ALM2_9FIRM|nr:pyridoxal 5'-phosphate synthase glutaminase subunit PdxT [Desulfofundulus australicus]SHF31123.1 pyridoxal phosphate synthase yaaE subunit [Desulfofundulus australicus DSM 11792]